jgi:hypothetical protein
MKKTTIILLTIALTSCSVSFTKSAFKGVVEGRQYVVHEVFDIVDSEKYLLDVYASDNPNQNYTKIITDSLYAQGDTIMISLKGL